MLAGLPIPISTLLSRIVKDELGSSVPMPILFKLVLTNTRSPKFVSPDTFKLFNTPTLVKLLLVILPPSAPAERTGISSIE